MSPGKFWTFIIITRITRGPIFDFSWKKLYDKVTRPTLDRLKNPKRNGIFLWQPRIKLQVRPYSREFFRRGRTVFIPSVLTFIIYFLFAKLRKYNNAPVYNSTIYILSATDIVITVISIIYSLRLKVFRLELCRYTVFFVFFFYDLEYFFKKKWPLRNTRILPDCHYLSKDGNFLCIFTVPKVVFRQKNNHQSSYIINSFSLYPESKKKL